MRKLVALACSLALTALSAFGASPAVTYRAMSNYVNSAISEAIGSGGIVQPPYVTASGPGKISVIREKLVGGVQTNETFVFSATKRETLGTRGGLRVIESNIPFLPSGSIMAQDGEKFVFAVTNSNGDVSRPYLMMTNIVKNIVDYKGVPDCWTNVAMFANGPLCVPYVLDGSNVYMSASISGVTYLGGGFLASAEGVLGYKTAAEGSDMFLTNRNVRIVVNGYRILDSTWKAIVGRDPDASSTPSEWVISSGGCEKRISIEMTQISPAVTMSVRRPSLLDLFVGSAYAAEPVTTFAEGVQQFITKPQTVVIDSFAWAVEVGFTIDGETPTSDKYTATPTEIEYCEPSVWYDKKEWVNWSPSDRRGVKIKVNVDSGGGVVETFDAWIRSEDEFISICDASGIALPSYDLKDPSFKKIEQCEDGGHIRGRKSVRGCVCLRCGVELQHNFGMKEGDECDVCLNYFDAYEMKGSAFKKLLDGGSGKQCLDSVITSPEDCYIESRHRGWNNEDVEGNDNINCSCQCGWYSLANNNLHNHQIPQDAEGGVTQWSETSKSGETSPDYHFGYVSCSRNCGKTDYEVRARHVIDASQIPVGRWTYVDNNDHKAYGQCTKCTYQGEILTNHTLSASASGKEKCWCSGCGHYCHHFNRSSWSCGGTFVFNRCARCGTSFLWGRDGSSSDVPGEWNEDDWAEVPESIANNYHEFGVILPSYDPDYNKKHRCKCGERLESHIHDGKTVNVTECDVCGWKSNSKRNDYDPLPPRPPRQEGDLPERPDDPDHPWTDEQKRESFMDKSAYSGTSSWVNVGSMPCEIEVSTSRISSYDNENTMIFDRTVSQFDSAIGDWLMPRIGSRDLGTDGDGFAATCKYDRNLMEVRTKAGVVQVYVWLGFLEVSGVKWYDETWGSVEWIYNHKEPKPMPWPYDD